MFNRVILSALLVASLLGIWPITVCRGDFNREACERACRSRYLGPGVFKDIDDGSGNQLMSLDTCMQECDRQFWKDFDKKTGDKERGGRRGTQ
ncbi:MAG TPA: hypothetical protein VK463_06895 [Desulfomonilaceae bacterium]|nr:hypothetical protein [Desulfomonilaceae bacterium]